MSEYVRQNLKEGQGGIDKCTARVEDFSFTQWVVDRSGRKKIKEDKVELAAPPEVYRSPHSTREKHVLL